MILLLVLAAAAPLDSLYQAGDYDRVVQLAPVFLADSARDQSDSIDVSLTYSFALVALGRTQDATAVFRRLIAENPLLTLDPEAVSPKIRAVFEQVKTEAVVPTPPTAVVRSETVYRERPMPLSVLVPGLHQISTGRRGAGYTLAGATAACLAGLVFSQIEYSNARTAYLGASTPQAIANTYHTADDWSHARFILSGTALALWVTSLVSALRSP